MPIRRRGIEPYRIVRGRDNQHATRVWLGDRLLWDGTRSVSVELDSARASGAALPIVAAAGPSVQLEVATGSAVAHAMVPSVVAVVLINAANASAAGRPLEVAAGAVCTVAAGRASAGGFPVLPHVSVDVAANLELGRGVALAAAIVPEAGAVTEVPVAAGDMQAYPLTGAVSVVAETPNGRGSAQGLPIVATVSPSIPYPSETLFPSETLYPGA